MISFIIPVYNAERYILGCVEQILKLKHRDFEIIVIDDGSADRTVELLSGVSDTRVRVYSQENRGVSAARNAGIQKARGEYVMFVDVDDRILPQGLDAVLDAVSPRCDLYLFAFEEEKNGHTRTVPLPVAPGCIGRKEDFADLQRRLLDVKFSKNYNARYFGGKVYQYLVSLEFLRNHEILFHEGIHFAEDCLFCLQCFQFARSMQALDIVAYHYVVYDDSASHRYREQYWEELKLFRSHVRQIIGTELENSGQLLFYHGNDVIKRSMFHFRGRGRKRNVCRMIETVLQDEEYQRAIRTIRYDQWSIKEKLVYRLSLRGNAGGLYWWLIFSEFVVRLKKCAGGPASRI